MQEWEAFYYFEPWGTPAEDHRASVITGVLWYPHFKGELPDFFDHDHEETARLEARREASITLEDKVLEFFGGLPVIASGDTQPA